MSHSVAFGHDTFPMKGRKRERERERGGGRRVARVWDRCYSPIHSLNSNFPPPLSPKEKQGKKKKKKHGREYVCYVLCVCGEDKKAKNGSAGPKTHAPMTIHAPTPSLPLFISSSLTSISISCLPTCLFWMRTRHTIQYSSWYLILCHPISHQPHPRQTKEEIRNRIMRTTAGGGGREGEGWRGEEYLIIFPTLLSPFYLFFRPKVPVLLPRINTKSTPNQHQYQYDNIKIGRRF
ncbi:hypothetical protein GGR50DRAFT_180999 [Xylaria sp. CBS 124048]|nr:hypothetical protein GGR50DRAFT_180999 [Xylaria sp. CBS 124048]